MNDAVLVHKPFEYRCVGGKILERRIERDRTRPEHKAWLVLDHGEIVPPVVLQYLKGPSQHGPLRFD
ncbi:MAG TPA: hypothetical protein VHD37_00445 [Candidatus Paceibacterota bacterium]|nr:hypothetical protein [Candidatus Paceibacterota bacterium]